MEFSAVCKTYCHDKSLWHEHEKVSVYCAICSIPIRLLDKIQDKILTPVFPDNILVPTSVVKQSKKKTDMLPQNSGNKVPTLCHATSQKSKDLNRTTVEAR
jgi:hypothetical protein